MHHIKLIFTFLICSLYTIPAQTQGNPENGPNDCLLNQTANCPISFMLNAFCLRDTASCWFFHGSETYRLKDKYFLQNYSEYLFGTPADVPLPQFPVLDTYPTATLHEIFEYLICFNDPNSCYSIGTNGLTIYHNSSECPPEQQENGGCHGGPRDSRICQVTPEACSGYFEPD